MVFNGQQKHLIRIINYRLQNGHASLPNWICRGNSCKVLRNTRLHLIVRIAVMVMHYTRAIASHNLQNVCCESIHYCLQI